jgi:hypothetical protein
VRPFQKEESAIRYTPRIPSLVALLFERTCRSTVGIGNSNAVLLRPSALRASVILMVGGDGYIAVGAGGTIGKLKGNQLVRTRNAYLAGGGLRCSL